MTACPECKSTDVDGETNYSRSDFNGDMGSNEVLDCVCNNCGCEFTETTETKLEVTKHGNECEEEEAINE